MDTRLRWDLFFNFMVPLIVKITLMAVCGALILTFAVIVGVENSLDVILANGSLDDIIDLDKYDHPGALFSSFLNSFPVIDGMGKLVSGYGREIDADLIRNVDTEIVKAFVLCIVLYVCDWAQKGVTRLSNSICGAIAETGLTSYGSVVRITTTFLCYAFSLLIATMAAEIVLMRFDKPLPTHVKVKILVVAVLAAVISAQLSGEKTLGLRSALQKFVLGPVCGVTASICVIFYTSMLNIMVQTGSFHPLAATLAVVFFACAVVLLYIGTRSHIKKTQGEMKLW